MDFYFLGFCLMATIGIGDGWSLRKHSGFSLVALPFKHHGIAPEFVESAPKQLLQVRINCWTSPVILSTIQVKV